MSRLITELVKIFQGEEEAAVAWCFGIAKEIVQTERAFRAEEKFDENRSRYLRSLFWERFENLENSLMSNGVVVPVNAINKGNHR